MLHQVNLKCSPIISTTLVVVLINLVQINEIFASSSSTLLSSSDHCYQSEAEKVLNDIRIVISSMPSDFTITNAQADMKLNVGNTVRGSNKLEHKCDVMRSIVSRILIYSSPCYLSNSVQFDNEIKLASAFLRQYCDDANHWSKLSCYSTSDLHKCEIAFAPTSVTITNAPIECPIYHNFFACVKRSIEMNCSTKDQSYAAIYLLDKAFDQAWKCGTGDSIRSTSHELMDRMSATHRQDSFSHNHQPSVNSIASHTGAYGPLNPSYNPMSHQIPSYNPTSYTNGLNQLPQSAYPINNQPNYPSISPTSAPSLPQHGNNINNGVNGVITSGISNPEMSAQDPIMAVRPGPYGDHSFSLFPAENCIERTSYYARGCEENLLQRQREARNARTAPDLQRRICCSLFFYHDCLSKTVIQYCRDASPTTVDIMMGQRKRELAITCRDHSREHCNSAQNLSSSTAFAIFATLIAKLIFM